MTNPSSAPDKTVHIPHPLWRNLKHLAADRDEPLQTTIATALEEWPPYIQWLKTQPKKKGAQHGSSMGN